MTKRLLEIRTGRQPHEVFILVLSIVIGCIGAVIPDQVGNAISSVLHGWPIHLYYAGLALFAAVTLLGVFSPKIEGLLVERAGLIVVGLYYAAFAVAVFAYAGAGGAMGTLLPIGYMVANGARVWQIHTDLALLKSYLADHPDDHFVR
jgi:hypothetical protein